MSKKKQIIVFAEKLRLIHQKPILCAYARDKYIYEGETLAESTPLMII